MIEIINGLKENSQYIGRGSPLGNPYKMLDTSNKERNRVCEEYNIWFSDKIRSRDQVVMVELRRLYQIAINRDLLLQCFCAPKRCHGETIKRFLDGYLGLFP
jgi:hypothetical protein